MLHTKLRIVVLGLLWICGVWMSCTSDSGVVHEPNTEQSAQEAGSENTTDANQEMLGQESVSSENGTDAAETVQESISEPSQDTTQGDSSSQDSAHDGSNQDTASSEESKDDPSAQEALADSSQQETSSQESPTDSASQDTLQSESAPDTSHQETTQQESERVSEASTSETVPEVSDQSTCATGQSLCQGRCVNPQTDPDHCGGCGQSCSSGQRCGGGQCQVGQQAQGWGGGLDDEGMGIVVDAQRNVYVTGRFQQTLQVGTNTFASKGSVDIFVAKFNAQGQVDWFRQAGGTDYDTGVEIALDRQGNVVIAGYFTGPVTFGTLSYTSSAGGDMFVAKLDNSGQWLWVKHTGGPQFDRAYGVTTDSKDNIYICGQLMGSATFGTISKGSAGSSDLFVAKLDSSGQWQWVEVAGGTDADYAWKVTTDLQDHVYVVGRFGGVAKFSTWTLTSRGSFDAYVAKLNTQGQWLWVQQAGGQGHDQTDGVVTDRQGNVYITGYFYSVLSGTTLTAGTFGTFTLAPQGGFDFFVARLDPQGNWQWVNYATGSDKDYSHDIGLDASGNVYIVGDTGSPSMTFGSLTVTTTVGSQQQRDIITASLDSKGQWIWAQASGGPGFDGSYDMAVTPDATVYITGHFSQTATLFGTLSLSSAGGYDIFVASTYRGRCAVSCATGTVCCLGTCRDLQQDDFNCGACGQTCALGQVCTSGQCQ